DDTTRFFKRRIIQPRQQLLFSMNIIDTKSVLIPKLNDVCRFSFSFFVFIYFFICIFFSFFIFFLFFFVSCCYSIIFYFFFYFFFLFFYFLLVCEFVCVHF